MRRIFERAEQGCQVFFISPGAERMNIRLEAGANLISANDFEFQFRIHICDCIAQLLILQALAMARARSYHHLVYFIPVRVIPLTIQRCERIKMNKTGKITSTEAAIVKCSCWECWLEYQFKMIGKVRTLCSVSTINGHK